MQLLANRSSLIILLLSLMMYSCTEPKNQVPIMKNQDQNTVEGLKQAINRLIEPDENFGVATLDEIYHDDMVVIMMDENDNKKVFRKEAFKKLITLNWKVRNVLITLGQNLFTLKLIKIKAIL